jgi:hypothetical protein
LSENHPQSLSADTWQRRALVLLAGLFAFRLGYLFFFCAEYDLAGDEAYYWDWGRRLDWGYYSKPPMIGWLMGLVGRLSGNAEWALRFAPLVLGTLSLGALCWLGREMFGARAAFFTLLFVAATPGNAALNLLFTIDAPLVLAWTVALLAFWRALQRPGALAAWLLVAAALGFGLLSKQMMLLFPVLMILAAALSKDHRAVLANPRFWAAIVLGAAFLMPNLLWQQRHGWPTVSHMSEHFVVGNPANQEQPDLGDHLGWFLQFPLTQAVLYSPVTWLLLMALLIAAIRAWPTLGGRERLLIVFSAPGLLVFHAMAARQDVHANWPAVYFVSAFVLFGGWLAGEADLIAARWRTWAWRGLWVSAALTLAVYVHPLMARPLGLAGHKRLDPMNELRAWKEAGDKAGEFLESVPRPEKTLVVVLGHRHHASELAFYMPQQPRVYRWQWDGRLASQYEVWPAPGGEFKGWDALVFQPDSEEKDEKKLSLSAFFRRGFDRVDDDADKIGDIEIPIGHGRSRGYGVFLCRNMSGWPLSVPAALEADPRLRELMDAKQRAAENARP